MDFLKNKTNLIINLLIISLISFILYFNFSNEKEIIKKDDAVEYNIRQNKAFNNDNNDIISYKSGIIKVNNKMLNVDETFNIYDIESVTYIFDTFIDIKLKKSDNILLFYDKEIEYKKVKLFLNSNVYKFRNFKIIEINKEVSKWETSKWQRSKWEKINWERIFYKIQYNNII